jgi:uncharacterized RDD family membrane protein YckC
MTARGSPLDLPPGWATPPWADPTTEPPPVRGEDLALRRPAGFWLRAGALLVDAGVWWLLLRVGDLATGALERWELIARAFDYTFWLVVPAAYIVLMHGTTGRTLGKMLVGARVVGVTGEPIGYPRALARYLAWFLSALPLLLGFVLAATRPDRRALHDLIAGTRVVRSR